MAKRKKYGGRIKGTPNKSTAEIKSLAQDYGEKAIRTLVKLMDRKDPDIALRASKELLDRGYGRPAQSVTVETPLDVRHLPTPELEALIVRLEQALAGSRRSQN